MKPSQMAESDGQRAAREYLEDKKHERDRQFAKAQAGLMIGVALLLAAVLTFYSLDTSAQGYSRCRSIVSGDIMIVPGNQCPRGFTWEGPA